MNLLNKMCLLTSGSEFSLLYHIVLFISDLSIHLFLFPDLQAKCEFDVAMTCDSCSTAITEILTKEKGKVPYI